MCGEKGAQPISVERILSVKLDISVKISNEISNLGNALTRKKNIQKSIILFSEKCQFLMKFKAVNGTFSLNSWSVFKIFFLLFGSANTSCDESSKQKEISCTKWRSILCFCFQRQKRWGKTPHNESHIVKWLHERTFSDREDQNHKFLNYCRINDIKWTQKKMNVITSLRMALVLVSMAKDNIKRVNIYVRYECFEFDSRVKRNFFFDDPHTDRDFCIVAFFFIIILVCNARFMNINSDYRFSMTLLIEN